MAAADEVGEALDALAEYAQRRREAHAAGLLRIVVVRHGARIVAALLGLADRSRRMSDLIGVDDGVTGQSFGTLAFAHLIDLAQSERRPFHFLRGEEAYTAAWGAQPTRTLRLALTPSAGQADGARPRPVA